MKKTVPEIDEQIDKIKENVKYIKENMKNLKGPIFVELLGTGKSGKTTLTNYFKQLLQKEGIPVKVRRETAEYNPIENKNSEEYEMWMIMEIMKNISEDLSDGNSKVVIYDRGILDRAIWLDFHVLWDSLSLKDSMLMKEWFKSDFLEKYRPIAYGLITSPELSVQRKGKPGRVINIENVTKYNECMEKEEGFITRCTGKYTTLKTDPYQGNLESFILDMTQALTNDIKERIRQQELSINNTCKIENAER